jgi:hypothetical protein
LKAADIIPFNNCINITYDSRGYYYEVPNYCINPPSKYDIVHNIENKIKPENKIAIVTVRKIPDEKLKNNYLQIIGSIIYGFTHCRLDLAFPVNIMT